MSITVRAVGPIFDGRALAITKELCDHITYEVAAQGYANVMTNLNASIRNPTPYYETQINVQSRAMHERVVGDRGVVYSGWLEGTSSRNQTTRFKGYASFRRAAQKTRAEAPMLTALIVARGVAAMGGVGIP